jgi:hypothetical protein
MLAGVPFLTNVGTGVSKKDKLRRNETLPLELVRNGMDPERTALVT